MGKNTRLGSSLRSQCNEVSNHEKYTFSTSADGLLTNNADLSVIVSSFPSCTISHAVGYGSGVFAQRKNNDDTSDTTLVRESNSNDGLSSLEATSKSSSMSAKQCSPMIDVILVVEDALQFHKENMIQNAIHYSSLAKFVLGPSGATRLQNIGPGVYFNPFTNVAGFQVKYGVISKEKLLADLLDWKYLYVAGRMHKPTACIGQGDDEILHAQNLNITSAISASLLTLVIDQELNKTQQRQETRVSFSQLFSALGRISYAGDFRMAVGAEDQNKVDKLIHSPGQYDRWVEMYTPALMEFRRLGVLDVVESKIDQHSCSSSTYVECNLHDFAIRKELIRHLPKVLRKKTEPYGINESIGAMLAMELVKIVAPAARIQGVKGLVTAGLSKSIKYAAAKFSKGRLK